MDSRSVEQKLVGVGGVPFFSAAPALADLLPSERERLIRERCGQQYREEVLRLAAIGHLDEEEEEG